MSNERGKIRNEEYAKQLRDFSGLRFGSITPTDIDGFVEFGDQIYIFYETKFGESTMREGQRLALERLVDCVGTSKHALLVIARHDESPESTIPVADCPVVFYRSSRKWRRPTRRMTVREITDEFIRKHRN